MSRERLTRLRKLERLRELEEERAAMAVRERRRERDLAQDAETEARASLEALAAGKRAPDGHALDLARYANTLALEAAGIDAVHAAVDRRRAAESAQREAVDSHGRAAAATEVVSTRRQRLLDTVRHEEEVRDADRLADLRAAQNGGSR